MATKINVSSSRTYVSEANMSRAVGKLNLPPEVRYLVVWNEQGRCYPVFVGGKATDYGVHFYYPVVN